MGLFVTPPTHAHSLFAGNTQRSVWTPDFSPELVSISTGTRHMLKKLRDGTCISLHLSLQPQERRLTCCVEMKILKSAKKNDTNKEGIA